MHDYFPSLKVDIGTSRTEKTFAILRADILACRLWPGQRLKIHELALRLGVSSGAVREALSRLSAEELVSSEAQKGFRVAAVQADVLDDLTRTRIEIESMCLRRAIAVGGIEWETRLVAAAHRLSRIPARIDSDEWAAAHSEYHLALIEACGSAWLLRLRAILYDQSERYRRLSLSPARSDRDIEEEHRAITEAALARDAERASKLLADHFLLTTELVRDLLVEACEANSKAAQAGGNDSKPKRSRRSKPLSPVNLNDVNNPAPHEPQN